MIVLGLVALIAALSFVGFTVDVGMINVTKSQMQAAADSAALAGAQEIVHAIMQVAENGGDGNDVAAASASAAAAAKTMAKDVVDLNGLYAEDGDIRLGKRIYDPATDDFNIVWGQGPYNMMEVTIRKDNPDVTAPDGKLELFFTPLYGDKTTTLEAKATAFINSRDIVSVLDFSGSMNFDSLPMSFTMQRLTWSDIRSNLDTIWTELVTSNVRFSNKGHIKKFPPNGFGKINSENGTKITSTSISSVYSQLDLDEDHLYVSTQSEFDLPVDVYARRRGRGGRSRRGGSPSPPPPPPAGPPPNHTSYAPFPQEGKYSNGNLKGMPSESTSEDLWEGYIDWVIDHSTSNNHWDGVKLKGSGYDLRYRYGYRTLAMYMLIRHRENDQSEDLWRVSAYPFKAVKDGMTLFTEFLNGLSFGDYLGLVTYGTDSQVETGLNDAGVDETVNLGDEHLTRNYLDIDTIQRHKQASHYSGATNIGDGLKDARNLLEEQGSQRNRPTILLMTDGAVNRPSSVPSYAKNYPFNWNALTDWDNDGVADYDNSDVYAYVAGNGYYPNQKKWVLYQAKKAADAGFTIHTISVGEGADQGLMRAVATIGHGVWKHVQAQDTESLQAELNLTFAIMGGLVPPASLLE